MCSEFTGQDAALWHIKFDIETLGEEDLEDVEVDDAIEAHECNARASEASKQRISQCRCQLERRLASPPRAPAQHGEGEGGKQERKAVQGRQGSASTSGSSCTRPSGTGLMRAASLPSSSEACMMRTYVTSMLPRAEDGVRHVAVHAGSRDVSESASRHGGNAVLEARGAVMQVDGFVVGDAVEALFKNGFW